MLDLVLLHGFLQDGRIWCDTADRLAPMFRVHTPDLPGFGTAGTAPLPCSVDDLAEAIQAYVRAKELKQFVLAGLSMGGYAALAWWRRYGQQHRPLGLALISTLAVADDEKMKGMRDALIRIVRKAGTPTAVSIVERSLWSPTAPDAVRDAMRKNMLEQLPEALIAGLEVMRDRPDAMPILQTIDVPTLVFGGTEDAVTPYPDMKTMADALPHCGQVWLEGAGHLAAFERAGEFEAALTRFLRSVAPRD